jgi:hypothetical protein
MRPLQTTICPYTWGKILGEIYYNASGMNVYEIATANRSACHWTFTESISRGRVMEDLKLRLDQFKFDGPHDG